MKDLRPGSREWLQKFIQEHEQAKEQALAAANANAGAVQAYQRLLNEMEKEEKEDELDA